MILNSMLFFNAHAFLEHVPHTGRIKTYLRYKNYLYKWVILHRTYHRHGNLVWSKIIYYVIYFFYFKVYCSEDHQK
jgi:hypothetical protein